MVFKTAVFNINNMYKWLACTAPECTSRILNDYKPWPVFDLSKKTVGVGDWRSPKVRGSRRRTCDISFNSNNTLLGHVCRSNGSKNYPHFIWVLVVSGFAGSGLEVSKPAPRRKFSATTGEVVLIQSGVKSCQPPGKSNTGLDPSPEGSIFASSSNISVQPTGAKMATESTAVARSDLS